MRTFGSLQSHWERVKQTRRGEWQPCRMVSFGPMPRLEPIVPARLSESQRALYDSLLASPRPRSRMVTENGALQGPFDPLLRNPAVGLPLHELGSAIRYSTSLDDAHRELAILVTAAAWRCEYEWRAHEPLAVAAGLAPSDLERLRDGDARFEEPTLQLVHDCAQELLRDRGLSDASFQALRDAVGEQQVFELLALVGYYSTLAGILNGFEIE